MARQTSPNSVTSIVSAMELNETIKFDNPYTSIAVMVSNLKKKEEQKEKIFKIKCVDKITSVTRIK